MEKVGKKYKGEITTKVWQAYHVKKNKRGFIIDSISDLATRMGTWILACKLMRKFQVATVPSYVIRVAGQCAKGGCFNWAQHLRDKFMSNVCESQEQGNAFFYSWLLFLIALVAWEAPKELVIPLLNLGMCEGARYAHLWDSKDAQRLEGNQVF